VIQKGETELLTLTQASEATGHDSSTLRRAIKNGHLSATRLGSLWVVTRAALDDWMSSTEAHKTGPKRKRTS
jgi:excisionase family DNA binding protein